MSFVDWSCKKREKEQYNLGNKDIRRWYQRDIDQITHSTGFRKLQRKSQLLSEKDPRSRSRLIHTIEVSRIAMEISEELGLSKELTEAICLGHDIATSPYGCVGNSFLKDKTGGAFSHEEAGSLMLLWLARKELNSEDEITSDIASLVQTHTDFRMHIIEHENSPFPLYVSRSASGIKGRQTKYYSHHISPEIIDGVLNHGSDGVPNTLEGQVVRFSDNIAYLSQDIEDLMLTGLLDQEDLKIYVGRDATIDGRKWSDIDVRPLPSLKGVFNANRGRRIATFVRRYVTYNLEQLKKGKLDYRKSSILQEDIPILVCDPGLEFIIDFMWKIIESYYDKTLIDTSDNLQRVKIDQLWSILQEERFSNNNPSYKDFMDFVSRNSLFAKYSDEWKMAYFISHLSWQDVDLIIDSFHERNYTFDLNLD